LNIKKIHNRGVLFSFDELNQPPFNCITNIYVIIGENNYYVCDTYLGPYYIKKIKSYLEASYGLKEYVVFNSHHHWDHIWGNCEFGDSKIISHEKCKELINKYGEEDLEFHKKQFAIDEIEILSPNVTFKDKIMVEKDGLEFFYSPGHSEDSSSCFDYEDKTLFVGDNIDDPIPSFFCWHELEIYKSTLEDYLSYNPERVIQSHGDVMSSDIIIKNIIYLDNLIKGKEMNFELDEINEKHKRNIEFINQTKNVEY
jgi:glyoxylase-like metal-dependent hydrolase (beta-lactamase superfamily II)